MRTAPLDVIKRRIEAALPGARVEILDPMRDGQHFQALVVSERFEGLSLVKQHQLVMNALKDAFEGPVHALQLKTLTPAQWDARKNGE